ncbi:putative endonuclease [Treponema pedis]
MSIQKNNGKIGKNGEILAAEWLKMQGYEIIALNWRTRDGEIDIIALDRAAFLVVFIEVKTLPNTPLEDLDIIINKKKQMKISKTAKHFIENNRQYNGMYMRFDVIVLKSNPFLAQQPEILHLKDAFGDCYE